MMLEAEQVNRLFSLDALVFIPVVVMIYHLLLLSQREWKAVLVFHLAGVLNFLLELGMILQGTRIVESFHLAS